MMIYIKERVLKPHKEVLSYSQFFQTNQTFCNSLCYKTKTNSQKCQALALLENCHSHLCNWPLVIMTELKIHFTNLFVMKGESLQLDRAFAVDPENHCGCKRFNCGETTSNKSFIIKNMKDLV